MLSRVNEKPIVSDREQLFLDLEASKATIRQDHAEIKFLKESLNRADSLNNAIKTALKTDLKHAAQLKLVINKTFATHEKEIPAARKILG